MKFDYSYRAFLITCLLFGILFLAVKSVTLSKHEITEEERFNLEYAREELLLEEELATLSQLDIKVETNRAYNEAEKFISEAEEAFAESQESYITSQESDQVLDPSNIEDAEIKNKKKPSNEEEWLPSDSESKRIVPKGSLSKKNSSVSYSLLNRSDLRIPNPVYLCATQGKIVINIVVSEAGKIIDTQYNRSASTSLNECLIDAALDYAKMARFTIFSGKKEQLGSITYNFPGQQ
jgi:hypothetical protein